MFHRLLIANRGEVAARIARACRDLGVAPVGVASRADLGASWLEAMDEVVTLGPAPASQSYLRGDRVLQAALQTHCTALHPGWGFLAEDARFAALCNQHGVTFVGPPPHVIARMGRKTPARAAMAALGVSGIPGSPGRLRDVDEAVSCAAEIGYPVLLKADSGGGGRGMRRCDEESELREAFGSASAEAAAAFGDGGVYLEAFLQGGRHVEVQVLVDGRGNAAHLGERDCSVQRKHQKLVEESPCPLLSEEERRALGEGAARAAAGIGYVGAGTLEYMRADDGRLLFLEMNTRLQVEHPVTEMTTGIDIVKEQIRIAAGHPLSFDPGAVAARGHAIEVRLNAEDPERDFLPTPGVLARFDIPTTGGPGTLRIDTHLSAGDEVPPHYDSLVAKVIAHGDDRDAAIETLLRALRGARIEGISTTAPLHLAVLASDAFRRGEYDTTAVPGWPPPA